MVSKGSESVFLKFMQSRSFCTTPSGIIRTENLDSSKLSERLCSASMWRSPKRQGLLHAHHTVVALIHFGPGLVEHSAVRHIIHNELNAETYSNTVRLTKYKYCTLLERSEDGSILCGFATNRTCADIESASFASGYFLSAKMEYNRYGSLFQINTVK
jgi:ribosomal protein L35AE/L33A